MPDWQEIWNRRTWNGGGATLAGLIAADGFDQGAGHITVPAWERYAEIVADWLGVAPGDSLFDVGCGAGAFVYPFYAAGHKVGGIDFSAGLVDGARQAMPGMDFQAAEACALDVASAYDFVVSNSVFHYFPDERYAEQVIDRMIAKARKAVAVLELPNRELQAEAEAARAAALPPGEYVKKYSGLRHQYYAKRRMEELGARLGCTVQVLDQQIDDYGNNQFRFNAIFHKQT